MATENPFDVKFTSGKLSANCITSIGGNQAVTGSNTIFAADKYRGGM